MLLVSLPPLFPCGEAAAACGGLDARTLEVRTKRKTYVFRADTDEGMSSWLQAMRIAQDPLVGQLISAAVGVDVGLAANRVAGSVNTTIWDEIGREEAAIRADPRSTNDPVLIGAFGVGSRL